MSKYGVFPGPHLDTFHTVVVTGIYVFSMLLTYGKTNCNLRKNRPK